MHLKINQIKLKAWKEYAAGTGCRGKTAQQKDHIREQRATRGCKKGDTEILEMLKEQIWQNKNTVLP